MEMNLLMVLNTALNSLKRNRLRTVLTMTGMVIGVAAVICTVAIGDGASQQVQNQIRSLGDNIVSITAGSVTRSGARMGNAATKTLTTEDAQAIQQQVPFIKSLSPVVATASQVVFQNQNWFTQINGVSPQYLDVRSWQLAQGESFSLDDVRDAANVCILGQTVAENLFGHADAVGQTVRVKNIPFRVLGVLTSKGESTYGGDQDDVILMPFTTVQRKVAGINWLNSIICAAISGNALNAAQQEIGGLLRQRHHLRPDEDDDFQIRNASDYAQAQSQSSHIMTLLLASIASISLLVGGIGIMNIMLVSVTERTREIGIRMAVGATGAVIQLQFLSESMALSLIGGTLGIMAGMAGSKLATNLLSWPTALSLGAVLIAVLFSTGVGLFFGYYPARKAALLDPIQALRFE